VYEIETITHHKQPHIPPAKRIVSGAKRCVFARQRIVSAAKRLISERQRIVFDAERLIAARKLIIPDAEQIIFAEKRIVYGAKLIISPVERIIRSCARRLSRNPDYRISQAKIFQRPDGSPAFQPLTFQPSGFRCQLSPVRSLKF
jgi:hypothetical protein